MLIMNSNLLSKKEENFSNENQVINEEFDSLENNGLIKEVHYPE